VEASVEVRDQRLVERRVVVVPDQEAGEDLQTAQVTAVGESGPVDGPG
jgi:hypothetical protein